MLSRVAPGWFSWHRSACVRTRAFWPQFPPSLLLSALCPCPVPCRALGLRSLLRALGASGTTAVTVTCLFVLLNGVAGLFLLGATVQGFFIDSGF